MVYSYGFLFNYLRNEFNFSNVHGIRLTLQETRSIHDSMNIRKIEFITYIFTFYIISRVSIFNFHLTWLVFQIF